MTSTKVVGLVLSLIVYLPVVFGNNIDLGGEPSYSLFIETSNTQLNHGDNFKIELSIAGLGDVEVSDILISIPVEIPKDEKVKFTEIDLIKTNNNRLNQVASAKDQPPRFWFLIPNIFYELIAINQTNFSGYSEMVSGASPISLGQARYTVNNYDYAPYTIDFVIADNAPQGDHEIPVTYNYKSKGKWYQDKEYIKIHINRFYETYNFYIMVAIFTVLSFITLIIQIFRGVFEARKFFKKFVKNWQIRK